jgi:hypothetical protein
MRGDPAGRIHRPRQIYVGETERPYVPIEERGKAKVSAEASTAGVV